MLSLIIVGLICAGIVTWWGYYTPFIIIGAAIFTVGVGLMTLFTVDQSSWRAYAFTIVAGTGCGLSIQNGYMAIQAVLPKETLPIGNAVAMFCQTFSYDPTHSSFDSVFSGALFLAVSQSILSNGLVDRLSGKIPNIDSAMILAAGATGIRNLVPENFLQLVLEAYNSAVRDVFIMGIALGACSTVASCFFEWKNVKGKNTAAEVA